MKIRLLCAPLAVLPFLMVMAVFGPPAFARDADAVPSDSVISDRINEAQIMRAAMLSSPDFQAVFRDETAEKADAEQQGRLQNPTIDVSARRASSDDGNKSAYELEIEQPLTLSQVTGRRAAFSQALFARAELRRQHAILQAYWQTKVLYAQAWQYQQQATLYADFHKRAQDAAARIRKSVQAGQTPVSEGSLFAGDAAKFASDMAHIKAQESQLFLQLEKVSGLSLRDKILEKPTLDVFNADIAFLRDQAQRNASLVRLLEADLRAAEYKSQAATADSVLPEIAPRFIYERTSAGNEDAVGAGLVLTIPLWDRNQAERRTALAEKIYARRQLDSLQILPLEERLRRVRETIDRLDDRIRALEEDALPQYRKGFAQAQKSFEAGQADALALWQIRERLFETERAVIEAVLEAIEARRLLSLETGIMPQEIIL